VIKNEIIDEEFLLNIYLNHINQGFFESKAIRNYTGNYKRGYRLLIAHYFTAAFFNEEPEFNWAQFNLSLMYMEKDMKEKVKVNQDFINEIEERSLKYLCDKKKLKLKKYDEQNSKFIINDEKLIEYVDFLKKYIKDKKTLFLYKDLSSFWDLNDLYKNEISEKHTEIYHHHTFELVPFRYSGPIHTFPEYFAYQDMINLWNLTINKYEIVKDEKEILNTTLRSDLYTYNSLLRTTLIVGVHFFETYLYYLYYNIKESHTFPKNKLCNRKDIRKINDKNILEELLFKEYKDIKGKTDKNYNVYLETLEYRDAFVHMSAFFDMGISRMQYLVDIDIDYLSKFLSNIITFIDILEEELGDKKILFWKNLFEWPDFNEISTKSNLKN
jgi:hypothetical protein